ncbi:MAG: glucuronate isomerase [Candidatus Marinimicrobia bacterium]|jgi:glucuronate isomerase|nr:glucuronate isomerase [Candidatus Neomarinimicrobiota bacterium]
MHLNPDRFFDSDPEIRSLARELYGSVKNLPIISPHGHVEAKILAEDLPFPNPTAMFILPDHYIYRLLYSQGIALESLGIATFDGTPVETDHRKIWQIFADNYYLFAGTPTSLWLTHELIEVFGVNEKLNSKNAMAIYDHLQNQLQKPEFRPRALYERFNIEVLTSTDGAADSLEYHRQLRESGWKGRVIPCFRPDALVNITESGWRQEIEALSRAVGFEVNTYQKFIEAIENRREFFKSMDAVSTDQGIESAYAHRLSLKDAEAIFQRALIGRADAEDNRQFTANMIMEMARMSVVDGLVMQIHIGSKRNHHQRNYRRFGLNTGADIPITSEFTVNLQELLNEYGDDPRLTLVVFTLDETTYARELAPLAGYYPAMKLGAAWWFHDSIQGMIRFREMVTETAGFYNTVGFTDDTRSFPSIPARHDLCRRVDANFLAGLTARHIIDPAEAHTLIKALAYDLAKKTYKL